MSIKDEILDILFSKRKNLTNKDLDTIDFKLEKLELSGEMDFDEIDQLKHGIDRIVGQLSIEPDSKLKSDGRT